VPERGDADVDRERKVILIVVGCEALVLIVALIAILAAWSYLGKAS
jgi:hypothetical protein